MLGIGQILDSPLVLFRVFVFLCELGINNLLLSLSHDLVLLSLGESLEVIGHESMRSQLTLSCWLILSHNIGHVGSVDFGLVWGLLLHSPFFFSGFFISGQFFVIFCQFSELLVLSHGHIVLHHASSSCNSLSLCSILRFFSLEIFLLPLVLSLLLFYPFFLKGGICLHSLTVIYKNKNHGQLTYSNPLLQIVCSRKCTLALAWRPSRIFL